MAWGGDRDFVDLGKALTDVHKCLIFGLRQDDIKVDRSQDADHHKHQEGKGLQCFLWKQKTRRQELDRYRVDFLEETGMEGILNFRILQHRPYFPMFLCQRDSWRQKF